MEVIILHEAGYEQAMKGLGLSYHTLGTRIREVAQTLALKGGGENKFLESMVVWMDVRAPRYWWAQFDTYRTGVTKQSESTMHTLLRDKLTQDSFARPIDATILCRLEHLRQKGRLEKLKNLLPEGFLQRRVVCANYKTLRNMINQRHNHKLYEWQLFVAIIKHGVAHKEFLLLPEAPRVVL